MKKWKLIALMEMAVLVLIVCIIGTGAWGQGRNIPHFISAGRYLEVNKQVQEAYVAGAADAFKLMTVLKPEEVNTKLFDSFKKIIVRFIMTFEDRILF